MFVTEPAQEIDVLDTVDVLVAGGGVAGCAAAVASARAGAKTLLVERSGALGGIAAANLVPNIDNHFFNAEGCQRIHGLAREVVERLVACGGAVEQWDRPDAKIVYDEQRLKIVLIEMLEEAGAAVLNHVVVCRPIMEDQSVKGVFVETKMGRRAILAGAVVDATGEADVAYQTGCPMRWNEGTASLVFKMGNVDIDAFYQYFREHPEEFPARLDGVRGFDEFEKNWLEYGNLYFPHTGGRHLPFLQEAIRRGDFDRRKGDVFGLDMFCLIGLKGLGTVTVNSMIWRVKSLDAPDLSRGAQQEQKACFYVADFFRAHVPGFQAARIIQISEHMGIRTSRGIVGEATLTARDVATWGGVRFDDVIGCRSAQPYLLSRFEASPVTDHPYDHDAGVVGRSPAQAPEEQGYLGHLPDTVDIPYGVMLPKGVDRLLVASGKSVSCVPQVLLRFQSTGMILGQAAGAAAALAATRGAIPRTLPVRDLQASLLDQGAFLGSEERLRQLGLRP